MIPKQDRIKPRTVEDLERMYAFKESRKNAKEGMRVANEAKEAANEGIRVANEAKEAAKGMESKLTQEEIFNRLTNNGQVQGFFMKDGQLYINANYIVSGAINADLITTGIINADLIKTGTINADLIKSGAINADLIKSGTINADLIKTGSLTSADGKSVIINLLKNTLKIDSPNFTLSEDGKASMSDATFKSSRPSIDNYGNPYDYPVSTEIKEGTIILEPKYDITGQGQHAVFDLLRFKWYDTTYALTLSTAVEPGEDGKFSLDLLNFSITKVG
jgi:hypothetical protein